MDKLIPPPIPQKPSNLPHLPLHLRQRLRRIDVRELAGVDLQQHKLVLVLTDDAAAAAVAGQREQLREEAGREETRVSTPPETAAIFSGCSRHSAMSRPTLSRRRSG